MLKQFKYINGIGRFDTFKGGPATALKKFTLVYSENGRGKTTLCSVLRSLSSGDSGPIQARRRMSAKGEPHAVVEFDGGEFAFDGKSWTKPGPKILVFDDHFTASNVCSGLEVAAGHRKNLHELVVGEDGVLLQRRVEDLTNEIAKHQAVLREKERAIPSTTLGGYSIDEFCNLAELENVDSEIAEAKKSVSVLRDEEKVRSTPEFGALALPVLATDRVQEVLGTALPDLDSAALAAVNGHLTRLGVAAENWVSEGTRFMTDEQCPYCGQGTAGSGLVAHYRRYFSEAYAAHKGKIADVARYLHDTLGGDRLARFQRLLEQAKERRAFWAGYIGELPRLDVDSEVLAQRWTEARDALSGPVEAKAAAPLEQFTLHVNAREAVERYNALAREMRSVSTGLLDKNESVARAKEHATHGNLGAAEAHLAMLEATKRRYEPEMAAKCSAYGQAEADKMVAEALKEKARLGLDEHRAKTFGKYQVAINKFLGKFNADFRLQSLVPTDPKGASSSTYSIGVNKGTVPLSTAKVEPSFATALSSGDRNTLALALFFAMLKERASLSDVVVVIDDAASSLDDGRCFATAQEIRALLSRAHQVVVMSHSRQLLCQLWEHADRANSATLCIRDVAEEASTIEAWDADAAAITEYDRLFSVVRAYAAESQGEPQQVAQSLRMLLEGFLRVRFVEEFPAGSLLGGFIQVARQAAHNGKPLLSTELLTELDELREYTNQFHHNTSKTWQENLTNVNETALKGFAKRITQFVRGEAP